MGVRRGKGEGVGEDSNFEIVPRFFSLGECGARRLKDARPRLRLFCSHGVTEPRLSASVKKHVSYARFYVTVQHFLVTMTACVTLVFTGTGVVCP